MALGDERLPNTDELPTTDEQDMYQREIIPELPLLEQREVELPLLIHGEPVLSPRGRRPSVSSCGSDQSCPLDELTTPFGSNLEDFPLGRPSRINVGNICKKNRPTTRYGPHNLPQSGFSHLSRQGKANNNMEDGFAKCCLQTDKLRCTEGVWKNALQAFCNEEFSIKTRHYHCCKKEGLVKDACFSNDAPNPTYDFSPKAAPLQEIGSADLPSLGSPRSFKPCPPTSPKCQKESQFKLANLSFPPGEPKSSNIQNICKLRKFRPVYSQDQLPHSGFGAYVRQAKAITRMESEFKKCCKNDNVACAHTAWEKVLAQFCSHDLAVKTKHYECCKKRDRAGMYSCFAREATYPEYDKEIDILNLSNVTLESLEKLCAGAKLLTKQKQIPLLVSDLRESCCKLPTEERLQCAEVQKDEFIETLCSAKKVSWKDSQNCCKKKSLEKVQCFSHYLQSVSVATAQSHTQE
ncbi:hypothetical protein FKM82_016170 [Ascaphus truei]